MKPSGKNVNLNETNLNLRATRVKKHESFVNSNGTVVKTHENNCEIGREKVYIVRGFTVKRSPNF